MNLACDKFVSHMWIRSKMLQANSWFWAHIKTNVHAQGKFLFDMNNLVSLYIPCYIEPARKWKNHHVSWEKCLIFESMFIANDRAFHKKYEITWSVWKIYYKYLYYVNEITSFVSKKFSFFLWKGRYSDFVLFSNISLCTLDISSRKVLVWYFPCSCSCRPRVLLCSMQKKLQHP